MLGIISYCRYFISDDSSHFHLRDDQSPPKKSMYVEFINSHSVHHDGIYTTQFRYRSMCANWPSGYVLYVFFCSGIPSRPRHVFWCWSWWVEPKSSPLCGIIAILTGTESKGLLSFFPVHHLSLYRYRLANSRHIDHVERLGWAISHTPLISHLKFQPLLVESD